MVKACKNCQKECQNTILICPSCGGREFFTGSQTPPPADTPTKQSVTTSEGFIGSISTCFTKYADFSGRASRSEYWWFFLFCGILSFIVEFIPEILLHNQNLNYASYASLWFFLSGIVTLVLFLPSLAVAVRRLHDIDRSGWWWLIWLTGIGIPVLIYFFCKKGDVSTNKYG